MPRRDAQRLSVCCFGCQQDYTNCYRRLWQKFSEKVRRGPAYKWSDFGGNLNQHLDAG